MTAKTGTERSRKSRALNPKPPEVRGIHAPPDDHPTIREAAKRLADRLAKKRRPTTTTKGC